MLVALKTRFLSKLELLFCTPIISLFVFVICGLISNDDFPSAIAVPSWL